MPGKVISNLEQLAEAIGSYVGMMEGLSQKDYMNDLLSRVHKRAAGEFDKFAVQQGMRDKSLSHMWEFGTAGITRGPIKYANPNSKTAKLWQHTIVGGGGRKTFGFVFLPAKADVPPHDPEEIGVSAENMPNLAVNNGTRRYKFKNKAFVYESGMTVTVTPKASKQLFVPIKTEGMPSGSYRGNPSRGFVWTKSHTYSPGQFADSTGRFSGMFGAWWAGVGGEMFKKDMMTEVEADIAQVATGIRPRKRMTSAQSTAVQSAFQRGKQKTRKQWTIKIRAGIGEEAEVIL